MLPTNPGGGPSPATAALCWSWATATPRSAHHPSPRPRHRLKFPPEDVFLQAPRSALTLRLTVHPGHRKITANFCAATSPATTPSGEAAEASQGPAVPPLLLPESRGRTGAGAADAARPVPSRPGTGRDTRGDRRLAVSERTTGSEDGGGGRNTGESQPPGQLC